MAEFLPLALLQKVKPPPPPPPEETGSVSTSQSVLQSRMTTPSPTQANQQIIDATTALAQEVSEVQALLQSVQSQLPTNSPLKVVGSILSNVTSTLSTGALAVFCPIVENYWTTTQDVIGMGLPETNVAPYTLPTSTQVNLFSLLQYIPQPMLGNLISCTQKEIGNQIQNIFGDNDKNDPVNATVLLGYQGLAVELGNHAETIALGYPQNLSLLSSTFSSSEFSDIQAILGQSSSSIFVRYGELSADAISTHSILKNDSDKHFKTAQQVQRLASVVGYAQGILNALQSNKAPTPQECQTIALELSQAVSTLYGTNLLSRSNKLSSLISRIQL